MIYIFYSNLKTELWAVELYWLAKTWQLTAYLILELPYELFPFVFWDFKCVADLINQTAKNSVSYFPPLTVCIYFHCLARIQTVYQEVNFLGKTQIAGFKVYQQLLRIPNFTETGKSNTCRRITENPSAVSETPAVSQSQLDKYHMTRSDNKHTAITSGRSKFTKIKGENTRKYS